MKITVLIDNLAPEGLICEWGLSFFIEYNGKNYLLDMGDSGDFAVNADRLGIRLDDVDYAVLSHAHYDHSDGMPMFFERNEKAPLFIRDGAGENCYGLNDEGEQYYVGIHEGYLEKFASRIRYAKGDYQIDEGVFLIPHKTGGREEIGKKVGMKIRLQEGWKTDTFEHEQSLVFRTAKGLVVFNSCSHAGPDHILREIGDTFPGEHVYAYLGGLHQYRSTEEEVRSLANIFRRAQVGHIYTGHCTGDEAYGILKEELGDQIWQFSSGFEVEL